MKIRLLRVLWIIVLFGGADLLHAKVPDSLYTQLQQAQVLPDPQARDSASIRAYAAIAVYRINEQDPQSPRLLDSLALLTEASSWPKAQGIWLRVKGRYHDVQGDMDQALRYYHRAIDTLRNCGPDYVDLSTAMIGAGFVLLNTGLYEQSMRTLKEAYQYSQLARHPKNQWLTLNFFGDYYYYSAFGQEQFDSALHYYLQSGRLIEVHHMSDYFRCDNDLGLANVYRRLGLADSAEKYWQQAFAVAEKSENYGTIYALYVDKAEVLQEQGDWDQALALMQEAYEYVQKSGWIEFIARADHHLHRAYKQVGDYEQALMHYEQYIAAQDSMKKNEATARYADLEAKYNSAAREEEITRLQNKNLQQSRNFLFGIAILGTVLIGFITWHNWNLRKKNAELKQKNQEIMLAQLKGQNIERRRMAIELHDNLNTKIAAIRWQLEALTPTVGDKARKILDSTLNLVNDVYDDVRLISHNLMPEKVEAIGLISALESLVEQLKQNNKVQFHVVVKTPPDFDFGSLTYPLYNILFEMINNILKHAEAENGWISISSEKDKIMLTVSDDGKGFEIDQMTNGYGIRNITSRLENIKGKWSVDSAPGKGTRFYIEVPIVHEA